MRILRGAFTDLHSLVEDAAPDLHHLQVLLLLVAGALDVGHPAPLVLLAGVDEVTYAAILVEHLRARIGSIFIHIYKYISRHVYIEQECSMSD